MHGQSDQLRLRSSVEQRDALDRFRGSTDQHLPLPYTASFTRWREHRCGDHRDHGEPRSTRRGGGRLREALALIGATAPETGEDTALAERAERLANAEELRLAAALARGSLSSDEGMPMPQSSSPRRGAHWSVRLTRSSRRSPKALPTSDTGSPIWQASLSAYLADLDESGPHDLAAVEERRAALTTLIRAHGSLERGSRTLWRPDPRDWPNSTTTVNESTVGGGARRGANVLDEAARSLTAARPTPPCDWAQLSPTSCTRGDAGRTPQVSVAVGADSAHGRDDVSILLSSAPRCRAARVSKGASGGELSRVMLAIEVVIAGTDPVPTFVSTRRCGIGGAAAIEVGRRLARLAESSQVSSSRTWRRSRLSPRTTSRSSRPATARSRPPVCDVGGRGEREAEMARLLSG